MTDASTRRIIASYTQESPAPMFLHGFFRSPPQNYHSTEMVEIDVQRDSDDVAIVIQDIATGARQNELPGYVNKAFAPPIYDEEVTISSYNLMKRDFGESPYDNPQFQAKVVTAAFRGFRLAENKIRRAIELQASQVLQTGKLTLTDAAGNALFALDYGPRAAHFPTVGVTWGADGTTGNPLGDIAALAEVIRTNGRREPKTLIFGSTALTRFLANKALKEQFANVGLQRLQEVNPQPASRGSGATNYGRVFIGGYFYEIWSYNATYRNPQTGLSTPYVDPDKVIMISDGARLDCSFGAIPRVGPPDPRVGQFLPARITGPDQGIDLSTFAWLTPDGKHLKVSAGTRPLCIPTGIDEFGCLDMTA
ncbi:MAG TPA: major capsid protein [Polyangiaceae bacterium]|nr:major capsid protein [Polyangiaceae bacterium]